MRNGIHIPAGVARLAALVLMVFLGFVAAREYPEVVRYLKAERM